MNRLSPYRVVAKNALINWNRLPEQEAEVQAMTLSHQELEDKIWAESSMKYAVQSIANELSLSKQEYELFLKAVIGNDNCNMSPEDIKTVNYVSSKLTHVQNKNKMIITALSTVHDGWVRDNAKKFYKPGREHKKYQHLPIELIGWDEAKADLLFVEPILDSLGISVNKQELKHFYEYTVEQYFINHGLLNGDREINVHQLSALICKGSSFYMPLTNENTPKTEQEATEIIQNQVIPRVENIITKVM